MLSVQPRRSLFQQYSWRRFLRREAEGTDTKNCVVLNQANQKGDPVQLLQPMWLARQYYVFGRSRSRLSLLRAENGKMMMMTAMARTATLIVHYSFLQTQYRVFTYIISWPSHTQPMRYDPYLMDEKTATQEIEINTPMIIQKVRSKSPTTNPDHSRSLCSIDLQRLRWENKGDLNK